LAKQEKYIDKFLRAKSYPQKLWNVERFSVEKMGRFFPSTTPVDKFFFSTLALWRKIPWGSNAKWTFPHNFVLLLLRLKIL